jgi:hypothetical protein
MLRDVCAIDSYNVGLQCNIFRPERYFEQKFIEDCGRPKYVKRSLSVPVIKLVLILFSLPEGTWNYATFGLLPHTGNPVNSTLPNPCFFFLADH